MKGSALSEVVICRFEELDDPGSREFRIGEGDWPFKGFVVRRDDEVFAYENYCAHAGHPLNWQPDDFLTEDGKQIVCASHGALYAIDSGVCVSGPCRGKELQRVSVEVRDGEVTVVGPISAPT